MQLWPRGGHREGGKAGGLTTHSIRDPARPGRRRRERGRRAVIVLADVAGHPAGLAFEPPVI